MIILDIGENLVINDVKENRDYRNDNKVVSIVIKVGKEILDIDIREKVVDKVTLEVENLIEMDDNVISKIITIKVIITIYLVKVMNLIVVKKEMNYEDSQEDKLSPILVIELLNDLNDELIRDSNLTVNNQVVLPKRDIIVVINNKQGKVVII